MAKVKLCKYCKEHNDNKRLAYSWSLLEHIKKCPHCGNEFEDTIIDEEDAKVIHYINWDNCIELLEAMIQLKEKNIIEYNLKMSQFRAILAQQEKDELDSIPKCPTCSSTDIEKISVGKKIVGGAMLGFFSSNVRNSMHCNSCGYKW